MVFCLSLITSTAMPENAEQRTPAPSSGKWQAADISNWRRWALIGLLFVAALINYLDRATLSVA
ncbi:MAG: hypothetical protein ACRD10_00355, partial [Terriglobia bacterium]